MVNDRTVPVLYRLPVLNLVSPVPKAPAAPSGAASFQRLVRVKCVPPPRQTYFSGHMLARSKPTRSSGLRHKTPGYLPRGSRLLATTRSRIPILEDTQSLASWRANLPPKIAKETAAMYSSVLGGIVLDPALMMIPIDDHMVHRGHSVVKFNPHRMSVRHTLAVTEGHAINFCAVV
eukprot:SAG31_NODE_1875_length_7019_cov_39.090896_4_plen_176_part_00